MPTSTIGTAGIRALAQTLGESGGTPGGQSDEIGLAGVTTTAQPLGEAGGVRMDEIGTVLVFVSASVLEEAKTGHRDFNLPYSVPIGSGEWSAYIVGRGGSPMKYEVPFTSVSVSRVVDTSASCSLNVIAPGASYTTCAEIVREVEPWADELLLYRSGDEAFVGPITVLEAGSDGARIEAQDLFYWMEKRFNDEDRTYWGDIAETFADVFEKLMVPDPSPNVSVEVHRTGIEAFKSYRGQDVQRGADILRELARTGLDFTTLGRRVYVGGKEVFVSTADPVAPLVLHDGGCAKVSVTKDGNLFATDVAVFSGSAEEDGTPRDEPLVGRSVGDTAFYGLVQSVFTELYIRDKKSADENALSRRLAMQPAPIRIEATLTPDSSFTFKDLIPGRRVDVRLAEAPIPVVETMRLAEARIDVQQGSMEQVTITLIPLGVSDLEIENA